MTQAYRALPEHSKPIYFGTLAEVQEDARKYTHQTNHTVEYQLVEMPDDKKSRIAERNGQDVEDEVLKRWRLGGARGRTLIEMCAGEEL